MLWGARPGQLCISVLLKHYKSTCVVLPAVLECTATARGQLRKVAGIREPPQNQAHYNCNVLPIKVSHHGNGMIKECGYRPFAYCRGFVVPTTGFVPWAPLETPTTVGGPLSCDPSQSEMRQNRATRTQSSAAGRSSSSPSTVMIRPLTFWTTSGAMASRNALSFPTNVTVFLFLPHLG